MTRYGLRTRSRAWLSHVSEWLELRGFAKWIALSALLGVLGGLAAVVFYHLVELAKRSVFVRVAGTDQGGIMADATPALIMIVPALGGLAVGLLIKFAKAERDGLGTDAIIRSFHRSKGRVRKRVASVTAAASTITIGTGGSGGQEGPVSQIGAGIGSTLAAALGFSDRDRRMFLMAGGSAGIAALFGSPLGAALFLPEAMYRREEFEGDAIIPCVVASTVAYSTFGAIVGHHHPIGVPAAVLDRLQFGGLDEILVYVVLGILCAAVGGLYVASLRVVDRLFNLLTFLPRWLHPAVGGLTVGVIAVWLGTRVEGHGVAFGGYTLIEAAMTSTLAITTLGLLVATKTIATAVTIGSGGAGGTFAPALSIGAVLGAFVGVTAAKLLPGLELEPAAFALVGMGGFFAGMGKVPIAAVVMVSEMTGNYELLAPLMIVSVVHMSLATRWSMYPSQVAAPLDSPAHAGEYIVDVLQSLHVRDVLDETDEPTLIDQSTTLRLAMRIVANSRDTHFPVVQRSDEHPYGELVGIFSLSDLRRIFLEHEVEDLVIARDFMREQVATVTPDDSLHDVQRLFTRRAVSALPVVDPENPRRVIALLKRNDVGKAYTERLQALKSG